MSGDRKFHESKNLPKIENLDKEWPRQDRPQVHSEPLKSVLSYRSRGGHFVRLKRRDAATVTPRCVSPC